MTGIFNQCILIWVAFFSCALASNYAAGQSDALDREEEMFGEASDDAPVDQSPAEPAAMPEAAPDESSRENEIFGSPEDSAASPTQAPGQSSVYDAGAESPDATLGVLSQRLFETDDILAIGGQVYMRLNYRRYEDVDNAAIDPNQLSSPNLVHLYLDGRPNDRVRAFVRGRLIYDFTVGEDSVDIFGMPRDATDAVLDQLWIRFDILRHLFVTFGSQLVRWGSSRFWNPTDFLNRERKNPLEVIDERLGVSLLKLHLPLEKLNTNLYAIASLDGVSNPEDVGGAFRAEVVLGNSEIALSTAVRKDHPLRLGMDLSTGLGDFDFHLEGALIHGEEKSFWRGTFDMETGQVPEAYSREDEWIGQLSAGSEFSVLYSDQDSVFFGMEYFFNDAAQGDPTLYPWLAVQGDFEPLYMGRHYIAAYVGLFAPGSWNDTSFNLSWIENISDSTHISRLDYQVKVLTYLKLGAFVSVYLGDQGEFHQTVEIPPIPNTPPFEEGLTIPASKWDIGLWLMLDI
ncbi:MAG: hypothetical protein QNJ97_09150 [Myxococcota bacterium]|nr:hypothetical protein [Myxococcota bacterium]